jgi:predicted esterase
MKCGEPFLSAQEKMGVDKAPAPEVLNIESAGTQSPLPTFLWRPLKSHTPRTLILQVAGGPLPRAKLDWDFFRDVTLEHGIAVAAVNLSGVKGFTQKLENESVAIRQHAQQLHDATVFFKAQGFEMVFILGSSYGAAVAVHSLTMGENETSQNKIAGLILLSSPPSQLPQNTSQWERFPSLQILAFHGVEDEIANHDTAERTLRTLFQDLTISLFAKEGHNFHRRETLAKIYADILTDLRN